MNPLLAQVEIRERTEDTCVSDNGFCPSWIADNFDRYVDPFFQHVLLTVVAVAIGFAIAFTLALIAYRHRWLSTRSRRSPACSTRSRASRRSSCCCR